MSNARSAERETFATWHAPVRIWLFAQLLLTLVPGLVLPAFLYVVLDRHGLDIGGALIILLLATVLVDASLAALEGVLALRSPYTLLAPRTSFPIAGALVVADTSSPPARVRETIETLLSVSYLVPLGVTLLYETPQQLLAVADLMGADENARVEALDTRGRTRVEAIQDAMQHVRGDFIGVFDAGQKPQRDAFTRAWTWLSDGYDAVQGHVAIENADESWVTRLAAVDRETAGSLPCAVAAVYGDDAWCEGHTYLSGEFVRRLANATYPMSTALSARMTYDRNLIAWEPAPEVLAGLVGQRLCRDLAVLRLPGTIVFQSLQRTRAARGRSLALIDALLWQPTYAWLVLQVPAVVAFRIWQQPSLHLNSRLLVLVLLAALYLFAATTIRTTFAYALAGPDVRGRWFWSYAALSVLFYAGLTHAILRAAQLRLVFGRRSAPEPARVPDHAALAVATEPDTVADTIPEPSGNMIPGEPDREDSPFLIDSEKPRLPEPLAWPKPNGHNGGEVIEAAHYLTGIVNRLIEEIDEQEEECRQLRARVEALEAQVKAQEPIRQALRELARSPVGGNELLTVRSLVQSLVRDPNHIVVLASVSQHADTLSRVIDSYIRLQEALQ